MQPILIRQSNPFSCGPCATLMARSYFENYQPSTEDEIMLWQQAKASKTFEYTTQPQLAQYLLGHKYETTLLHEHSEGFVVGNLPRKQFEQRMKIYRKHWKDAENKGMISSIAPISAERVAQHVMNPEEVMIILTTYNQFTEYFHHVLAYDADDTHICVADSVAGFYQLAYGDLEKRMRLPNGVGALLIRKEG